MLPTAATLFEKMPRMLRRHRLMATWMRFTGESPIQLVRIREEAFGYADLSEGFLRLIIIEGDFERDFFRIGDALLQRGGIFFDVGANLGLLSFGLAYKFAECVQFHLFEPNPVLRNLVRKSQLRYPTTQMFINSEAISAQNGAVEIHFEEGHLGMSHVVKNGGTTVSALTLDTYLTKQKILQVDFLKMDIEGHELSAFYGAEQALKERRINAIYFEYCEKWLLRHHQPQVLLDYLASLDYEVCFCREADIRAQGGAVCTLAAKFPGNGLPLVPIKGRKVPPITDLLAVPRENLTAL